MRQQINFYRDSFRPKRDLLRLDNMLLVWLAGLVISVVLYVFEQDRLDRVKFRQAQAQAQQDRLQNQLVDLQNSFSDRGDLSQLTQTLNDLKQRHGTLEAVLTQLGLRTAGMEEGIAGIMTSLSQLKMKATWLTEISIYHGQLSVMGQTRDPKQVPILIKQLEQLEGLTDKRFARLQMVVDQESSIHQFSLQSIDFVAPPAVDGGRQ